MSERFVGIDGAFLQGYDKGFQEGLAKGKRYMEELIDNDPPEVDILEERQRPLREDSYKDLGDGTVEVTTRWNLNHPDCPIVVISDGTFGKS